MLFDQLLTAVNGKTLQTPTLLKVWEEAADRISVHAKGIRPRFRSPKAANAGQWITPANYDKRYQYLFDNYILNRHPNENETHYYWRLSTFPLIAQEIYLNAKSQMLGAIFQASQYRIAANNKDDQEYLDKIQFTKKLSNDFAEHIFTDPHGKFAVVETHFGEFPVTESAAPGVECVESRNIRAYQKDEYIIFQASEKYNGKTLLYYIDKTFCVKLLEQTDSKDFFILASYQHGFGALPVVDNDTHFFQKFVSWADMLARNISDDEVIAKNASYPHKQVIEPVCQKCMGQKEIQVKDDRSPVGFRVESCDGCGGRGTISMNIGEVFVVREPTRDDARPIPDHVKFINPDISINDFSFKRWKEIYDFGMRSMHMKYVEESQSGVAKAFDREQLYFLISNVSNKIFDVARELIKYLLAYLHLKIENSNTVHDFAQFVVSEPQQFQIKTEYDIQAEYTDLVTKNVDINVRRAKLDEYMAKAYKGNPVMLKRYESIKLFDWLYGMSDNELNTRKLLGSAGTNDFIRHDRAQFILNQIQDVRGMDWIIEKELNAIVAEMQTMVAEYLVADAIQMPPDVGSLIKPAAGAQGSAAPPPTDPVFDSGSANDNAPTRQQQRQNG